MSGYWQHRTGLGIFFIMPRNDGRFTLMFENEALESHHSPESAAQEVAGGHCYWPSIGNPSRLGIPEELSEWTWVANGT